MSYTVTSITAVVSFSFEHSHSPQSTSAVPNLQVSLCKFQVLEWRIYVSDWSMCRKILLSDEKFQTQRAQNEKSKKQ